jgi:arginine N-succinyltransferase
VSYRVRPAHRDDFQAIYEMAKLTGGGFTNLPPDRRALAEKIDRSARSFARDTDVQSDELFLFVVESDRGQIKGTCQIFGMIGSKLPFYSYRISTLTQTSTELGRTFRAEMLSLVTDFDGSSEVGGLFLHPGERAAGLGLLLARSRYLFIKGHRRRFGERLIAELRGVIDEAGGSPFWDAIAGRFFGMTFQEADEFNATHGNQFIADLMPKTPIYTAMLPESARAIIGVPHPSGRAAMKMLEREGFKYDGYIDIFDGGPTMSVAIDDILTIRDSRTLTFAGKHDASGADRDIVSAGHLTSFRACYAEVKENPDGSATLDTEGARLLGIQPGETFLAKSR